MDQMTETEMSVVAGLVLHETDVAFPVKRQRGRVQNEAGEWKKRCTSCGQARDCGYSTYCRECRNLANRVKRRDVAAALEHKKRMDCRRRTLQLIHRGLLVPRPCEDCSTTIQIQAHHTDYESPWHVQWKCATCHRAHHRADYGSYGRSHGTCARCGGPRDRGQEKAYCRTCHNAYARSNRKTHSELSPEARARANCRAYTKQLVKRGQLVKTPCACGAVEVTAVHHDYSDPRNVTWACQACRTGRTDQRPAVAA
jgi:hypothetical protein